MSEDTEPRIGGQRHLCMYLWPSPFPPDNPDSQVHLCWHKSKWLPPGQGLDKACPFLNDETAKKCPMYTARRQPSQVESHQKVAIASIKEQQGPDYWTGDEAEKVSNP